MSLFPQTLRRQLGIVFLVLAVLSFVGGMVISRTDYRSIAAILCWMGCFVSTFLAMVMALLDLRAIRKNWIQQHRNLLETSLSDIATAKKNRVSRGTQTDESSPTNDGLAQREGGSDT